MPGSGSLRFDSPYDLDVRQLVLNALDPALALATPERCALGPVPFRRPGR
ncbi:hypothetical protein [Streptomyces noursei]|nr:hypothetical protein [Streptomyces noursei]MCZ1021018.1 hypothetical protein [Streptomyces noursei]GGX48664.1 hypothetical protein GCM10010341_82990 [Streptomyces noursei]